MIPALVIAAIVMLVGAVIYISYRAEKKRTVEFAAAAADLGFEFFPLGDKELEGRCAGLHLFSQGHSKKLRNVLRGRTNDLDVALFDYTFTTGHGKHAHTHRTTGACFQADLRLPAFSLRPEGFWQKVGSLLGYKDINFDSHPQFSKAYQLKGPDEEVIREAFDEAVLDFFQAKPGLSVEAAGDVLVFYRQDKRVPPAEMKAFMAEAFQVLDQFRPPAESVE